MKKLIYVAVLALSLMATISPVQATNPWPECNPCPMVR